MVSKKRWYQKKDYSQAKYTKDIKLNEINNKLNKSLIYNIITPKLKGIIDFNPSKKKISPQFTLLMAIPQHPLLIIVILNQIL